MDKLFNTVFENSLRILILLDVFQKPQNMDMIYVTDFMTVYGETFKITEHNLNGNNILKFSEFISRRPLVQKVLKQLILSGLAETTDFLYSITPMGRRYCQAFESHYAELYRTSAIKVISAVGQKNERELIAEINRLSKNMN